MIITAVLCLALVICLFIFSVFFKTLTQIRRTNNILETKGDTEIKFQMENWLVALTCLTVPTFIAVSIGLLKLIGVIG